MDVEVSDGGWVGFFVVYMAVRFVISIFFVLKFFGFYRERGEVLSFVLG